MARSYHSSWSDLLVGRSGWASVESATLPHDVRRTPFNPARSSASTGPAAGSFARVLWLVKGLGPGGVERLLTLSARRRDRERFQVRVGYLLPHKVALIPELEAEGVPVSCLGRTRLADPRWLWTLRRSLLDDPVDLVHAHSPLAAIGARVVVRSLPRARRPHLITTEHSLWTGHVRVTRFLNALTWRFDDAHLAVSRAIRASIPARLGRSVEVVAHGVDVEQVRSELPFRAQVRRELGIAPEALVVGTVANLRPVKAYPDLLAAARQVIAQRPDVRFVTVGQGPQEEEIRRLHADLGLGDGVLLLGHRPDAVRVMAACDVFCLPSLHEGLPVALMEALALGLPVVASAVGGIIEVVDDGCQGVLVEPAQPDRLSQALLEVLGDPELRRTMAAASAARGATLSIGQAVTRTEEVYEAVLAHSI